MFLSGCLGGLQLYVEQYGHPRIGDTYLLKLPAKNEING